MAIRSKFIGPISAYAIAVANGYTGTEQEFAQEIANASTNAATAQAAADHCDDVLESIPQDYSSLSDDVDDLKSATAGRLLSDEIKATLLDCLSKVAWATPDGQEAYNALDNALNPPLNLVSITAVYTQTGAVYPIDSLSSLRSDLVVTANYTGGESTRIYAYILSGTLTVGTSVITISYGGKTTTFNVTVTDNTLIYQLPSPVTFDGSAAGIINTGVNLFPTDRDLTITLSIIGPTTHNYDWIFWYGTTTSPYRGMNMQYRNNGVYALCTPSNSGSDQALCSSYRNGSVTKYVIRKHSGSNAEIYCYNVDGGDSSGVTNINNVVAPSSVLMLGGVGESSFDSYNYKGTISDFKVYTRYFTDDEKAQYLEV